VFNWVQSFNIGMETAQNGICLVAQTSRTSATVQIIFHFIMVDRCITFDELQCENRPWPSSSSQHHPQGFEDEKSVCTLGPSDLTQQQKETRVDICHQLLALHYHDVKDFFARLVIGHESWLHYHTPEKKRQSMQRKDPGTP
jgi:hypothetical protein